MACQVVINSVKRDVDRGSNNDDTSHSQEGLCKDITLIHRGRRLSAKGLPNAKGLGAVGCCLAPGTSYSAISLFVLRQRSMGLLASCSV